MKYHQLILWIFASILTAFPVKASGTTLAVALKPVRERDKILADELQKLAAVSPQIMKIILEDPSNRKDPSSRYYLWEFCYRTLQQEHWGLRRVQTEYSHLCAEAGLVACLHAGDGQHYAVFTDGGIGPMIATEDKKEGFTFYQAQTPGMLAADTECDYDVAPDERGDILLARMYSKPYAGQKFETVITEHLYIRDHTLKRLKRVTEEYPVRDK